MSQYESTERNLRCMSLSEAVEERSAYRDELQTIKDLGSEQDMDDKDRIKFLDHIIQFILEDVVRRTGSTKDAVARR